MCFYRLGFRRPMLKIFGEFIAYDLMDDMKLYINCENIKWIHCFYLRKMFPKKLLIPSVFQSICAYPYSKNKSRKFFNIGLICKNKSRKTIFFTVDAQK